VPVADMGLLAVMTFSRQSTADQVGRRLAAARTLHDLQGVQRDRRGDGGGQGGRATCMRWASC
jgi:hypothetical protein